jgi:hypothetical protein
MPTGPLDQIYETPEVYAIPENPNTPITFGPVTCFSYKLQDRHAHTFPKA